MALDIVLLWDPRGLLFLIGEVPLCCMQALGGLRMSHSTQSVTAPRPPRFSVDRIPDCDWFAPSPFAPAPT